MSFIFHLSTMYPADMDIWVAGVYMLSLSYIYIRYTVPRWHGIALSLSILDYNLLLYVVVSVVVL